MSDTVKFKYELGVRVKDRVSEMIGIVDMRAQYLNGCIRYSVQPKIKKDGDRPESWWIDEAQIELVDEGLNKKPVKIKRTGGPSTESSSARM